MAAEWTPERGGGATVVGDGQAVEKGGEVVRVRAVLDRLGFNGYPDEWR
jgi:hypothetical protein